jgi:hypothetical protein
MGILEKLRRRMRRSRDGSKDALTVVSTCDETYFIGESNNEETYSRLFSDELLSPHNGAIVTTSAAKSCKPMTFFGDDEPILPEEAQFGNHSSDEERDDVRLLLATSTSSDSNRGSSAYYYSFDQHYEEEIIFEPSFEVALMDPETLLLASPRAEVMPEVEAAAEDSSTDKVSKSAHLSSVPFPQKPPKPQKRYDLYGRSFVHIFHEGLATLYESDEEGREAVPPIATRSKLVSVKQSVSDDVQIRARWELAKEQMTTGVTSDDWDGILSPRSGIRSAYEI